jgi:predicted TIM-barrel fold metal-dependent hydrolase
MTCAKELSLMPVVIDHFGLVKDMNDKCFLSMLASKLNLFIKLSAPYRFEYKNIDALIDTIITYRGLQNILWGSDYPFTRFEDEYSYDKAVDFISQYGSNNINVNIKKHLFDNAMSLFDFQ